MVGIAHNLKSKFFFEEHFLDFNIKLSHSSSVRVTKERDKGCFLNPLRRRRGGGSDRVNDRELEGGREGGANRHL